MKPLSDPAVVLAALRAGGALSASIVTASALEEVRARAEASGRVLLHYAQPSANGNGHSRVLTLGWSPHATPSPEDDNAYLVRRLTPTARLTWACCLGLAWPDRSTEPHPGESFSASLVIDVAAELGLGSPWVKNALYNDLIPAHLVEAFGSGLRLGPAAAAIPPAFVEAIRRFHDQLPRPDQIPVDTSTSESFEEDPD